jgi:dihydroorotate dehydrogenase
MPLIGGIKVAPVLPMSGAVSFFREIPWPHHEQLKKLFGKWFTFVGTTFVAKTTTVGPRVGNMPMKEDGITPKERKPKCIILNVWNWLLGVMLNAVGLSGPGAEALFAMGYWQRYTENFMLSFMSVEKDMELRLAEFERYLIILVKYLPQFIARIILQANMSCPNVKMEKKSDDLLYRECLGFLDLALRYIPGVPILFKINVFMSPDVMVRLQDHPSFGGVCVSNTLPWDSLKWWQKWLYFPSSIFTGKSPLHHLGGGGVSGTPLRSLVEEWVWKARRAGFTRHINAGGGIQHRKHVTRMKFAGADSVSIGAVFNLRPWRLLGIIEQAYIDFPEVETN